MNPEMLKAIDPVARLLGFYTSYELHESEFVGTVEIDTSNVFNDPENMNPPFVMEHDLYHYLEWIGYERNPTFMGLSLVAAKQHPETGRVHDVSLRKVDPENERRQYHLHYWVDRHSAQIAVHWEYRPDFEILEGETLGEAVERLRTHYRPDWSTDEYQKGKACEKLKNLMRSQ